jgi:hypothetical protein
VQKADNSAGFIDKTGKEIVPCIYESASGFSTYIFTNGMAKVKRNGKWGVINANGKEIVPCIYEQRSWTEIQYGYIITEQYGKEGIIDNTGAILVPCRYDKIVLHAQWKMGGAMVFKNNKVGYVEIATGKEILPCIYEYLCGETGCIGDIYFDDNGFATVVKDAKRGIVDKTGKEISPCVYDLYGEIAIVSKEFAIVTKKSKKGIVEIATKKEIVPCIYDDVFSYSDGFACVKNTNTSFVDKTGKKLLSVPYKSIGFSDGLATVFKQEKAGLINKTGTVVVPFIYDGMEVFDDDYAGEILYNEITFSEGLAKVKKNGKYGFIDSEGKEVIPCIYNEATAFSNGLACVQKNNDYTKCNIIDKNGNEMVPYIYDEMDCYTGTSNAEYPYKDKGLLRVKRNSKWGMIDHAGKEAIPCIYDKINKFVNGLAQVQKHKKWGFIDYTGKEVIPCIYREAEEFHEGLAKVTKDDVSGLLDAEGYFIGPGFVELPYYVQRDNLHSRYSRFFPDKAAFEKEYDAKGKAAMTAKAQAAENAYLKERASVYAHYAKYFPDKAAFETEYDEIGKQAMTAKAQAAENVYLEERDNLYARYEKYYPNKTAFESLYDQSGKTEMAKIAQQEADRQDFEVFKQWAEDIKSTDFDKIKKDKKGMIQKVADFKNRAVYPEVVKFVIANNKELSKKWEKEGNYFADETELYESFVSGDYKNILNTKKKETR